MELHQSVVIANLFIFNPCHHHYHHHQHHHFYLCHHQHHHCQLCLLGLTGSVSMLLTVSCWKSNVNAGGFKLTQRVWFVAVRWGYFLVPVCPGLEGLQLQHSPHLTRLNTSSLISLSFLAHNYPLKNAWLLLLLLLSRRLQLHTLIKATNNNNNNNKNEKTKDKNMNAHLFMQWRDDWDQRPPKSLAPCVVPSGGGW